MIKPFARNKPRSAAAQVNRMAMRWPDFEFSQDPITGTLRWKGPLRGFQRFYTIGIFYNPAVFDRPYVYLITPSLAPREGRTYAEIPHLIYDAENPESSGLCLFDPQGKEWSEGMLIADTTLPWAAKWLYYYELWHYDGTWRGGGVGPESAACARTEAVHDAETERASNPKGETPVAIRQAVQDTLP